MIEELYMVYRRRFKSFTSTTSLSSHSSLMNDIMLFTSFSKLKLFSTSQSFKMSKSSSMVLSSKSFKVYMKSSKLKVFILSSRSLKSSYVSINESLKSSIIKSQFSTFSKRKPFLMFIWRKNCKSPQFKTFSKKVSLLNISSSAIVNETLVSK